MRRSAARSRATATPSRMSASWGLILQPASSASWKRAVPFRTLPSRVWSIPLVPRRPQAVWWAPTTAPSSTARSPVLSTARRRRAVWWAAMRRAEPSTTAPPVPWSAVRIPPAASWATTSVSSPAAPMWVPSTPSIRSPPSIWRASRPPCWSWSRRIWAMT